MRGLYCNNHDFCNINMKLSVGVVSSPSNYASSFTRFQFLMKLYNNGLN